MSEASSVRSGPTSGYYYIALAGGGNLAATFVALDKAVSVRYLNFSTSQKWLIKNDGEKYTIYPKLDETSSVNAVINNLESLVVCSKVNVPDKWTISADKTGVYIWGNFNEQQNWWYITPRADPRQPSSTATSVQDGLAVELVNTLGKQTQRWNLVPTSAA